MDNRLDDLVDNEKFYKIMNPYIESGMLTEIYASNYISVFNFSNKIYVTCLHMVLNDSVVGHLSTKSFIKKEIEDNLQAFEIQETSGKIFPGSCYLFNKERFSYWQKYITNLEIECYTDSKLDEEIMKKYPKEATNNKSL